MKILITGGAGFIGSHVADRLIAAGHDVHIVDDLSTGKRHNLPSAAAFHELDIRSAEAARLVEHGGFDLVAHLAAQVDVRVSVSDPSRDAAANVIGTLDLLEAARRCARPPRVVFASTGGMLYGDFVTPPNVETFPKDPDNPYGISKLAAEYYLAYYGRVQGMECVTLRFGNVYGPRQDPHGDAGVIAIFCGRAREGKPLVIYGDGTQVRDYVYVGDVAEAFVRMATIPAAALPPQQQVDSRAFNVGSGIGTSVLEIAELVRRVSGRDVPIEFAAERRGEIQHGGLDPSKAERVLGWKAQVGLEEGLRRTWEWASRSRDGVVAPTSGR